MSRDDIFAEHLIDNCGQRGGDCFSFANSVHAAGKDFEAESVRSVAEVS